MRPCWFWISISDSGFYSGAAIRPRVPAEGLSHGKVPLIFLVWNVEGPSQRFQCFIVVFLSWGWEGMEPENRLPPPTPLLGVDFGKFQVLGLWSVQWKNDTHFLGSWWSSKWNDVPTPPGMQSCRFLFPSLSVNPILPLLLAHFHLPFPKPGLHTWLWAHLSLSLACPAVFPDSCEPPFLHSLYKLRRNPSERKELAHTLKVSCKHFAEHNDAEPVVSRQMLVALRQCEGRLALWTQVEAHLLASTRAHLSELGRAFTVLCGFRKRRR